MLGPEQSHIDMQIRVYPSQASMEGNSNRIKCCLFISQSFLTIIITSSTGPISCMSRDTHIMIDNAVAIEPDFKVNVRLLTLCFCHRFASTDNDSFSFAFKSATLIPYSRPKTDSIEANPSRLEMRDNMPNVFCAHCSSVPPYLFITYPLRDQQIRCSPITTTHHHSAGLQL